MPKVIERVPRPPLVSIALPSYNYARFLPGALDAFLGQLEQGLELEVVLVDDGSTDASWDIAQEYARAHSSIRAYRNPCNMGVHFTVNRCIELALGRYINFAAVDDRMLPSMVANGLTMLEANPGAAFCTAPVRYVDETGAVAAPWPGPGLRDRVYVGPEASRDLMRRYGFWVVSGSTLYRLDLVRAEGGYDASIGHMADSFLAQILALRHGFCSLASSQAEVRLMPTSYSGTERASLYETQMIRKRVVEIMRRTPELFPPDFLESWEEMWAVLDVLQSWQRTILARQKDFAGPGLATFRPRPTWFDKTFIILIKAQSMLQYLTLAMWCGLRVIDNRLARNYLSPRRLISWLKRQF